MANSGGLGAVFAAMSDCEVLQAGRDDVPGACAELYRRHGTAVAAYLRRRCDAELAEELTQETFLRVLTKMGRIDPDRPLLPWLCTVAHNLLIDTRRYRTRRPQQPTASDALERAAAPLAAGGTADRVADADLVARALGMVPDRQRKALELAYLQDGGVEALVSQFGVSANAARQLLHRSRESFAQACATLGEKLRGLLPQLEQWLRWLSPSNPALAVALVLPFAVSGALVAHATPPPPQLPPAASQQQSPLSPEPPQDPTPAAPAAQPQAQPGPPPAPAAPELLVPPPPEPGGGAVVAPGVGLEAGFDRTGDVVEGGMVVSVPGTDTEVISSRQTHVCTGRVTGDALCDVLEISGWGLGMLGGMLPGVTPTPAPAPTGDPAPSGPTTLTPE